MYKRQTQTASGKPGAVHYLAEKTGRFLPTSTAERGPLLSWLMFVATGVGPFSGQAVHFRHFALEPVPYASERYAYEARRHYGVLESHLSGRQYMVGEPPRVSRRPFGLGQAAKAWTSVWA